MRVTKIVKGLFILLSEINELIRKIKSRLKATFKWTWSRAGVHNSNLKAGQNYFLAIPKGQNYLFWPIQRVHLSRIHAISTHFWSKCAKSKGFAGHIWPAGRMLSMSGLEASRCIMWSSSTLPISFFPPRSVEVVVVEEVEFLLICFSFSFYKNDLKKTFFKETF